ncbi:MAG: hypothetical protein LBL38_03700 [Lactobacillales bacterium]|jgi:hypothetical protein|nr:hypothetical protein [Lactobacillales bacterium]
MKKRNIKTKFLVTLAISVALNLNLLIGTQTGYAIVDFERLQQQSADKFKGKDDSNSFYAENFREKLNAVEGKLIRSEISPEDDSDRSILDCLRSVIENEGINWRSKFKFFSCIADSMLIKYAARENSVTDTMYRSGWQELVAKAKTNLSQIIKGDNNFSSKLKSEITSKIESADVYIPGISKIVPWNFDFLQRFVIKYDELTYNRLNYDKLNYDNQNANESQINELEQSFKIEFPEGYEFLREIQDKFHYPNAMLTCDGSQEPSSNEIKLLPGVFLGRLFSGESIEVQIAIATQIIGHELGHIVGEYFIENWYSNSLHFWGVITPQTIAEFTEVDPTKTFGEQWEQLAKEQFTERLLSEKVQNLLIVPEERDRIYAKKAFDSIVAYFAQLPDNPDTYLYQHKGHQAKIDPDTGEVVGSVEIVLNPPKPLGSIKDMGRTYFQEVLADAIGLKVALHQSSIDPNITYQALIDHCYQMRTEECGIGFDVRYPVTPYRGKAIIELVDNSDPNTLFPI